MIRCRPIVPFSWIDQRIADRENAWRKVLISSQRIRMHWVQPVLPVHTSSIVTVGARALILGPDGKPLEMPK